MDRKESYSGIEVFPHDECLELSQFGCWSKPCLIKTGLKLSGVDTLEAGGCGKEETDF